MAKKAKPLDFYASETYTEDGVHRIYTRHVGFVQAHWVPGYQRIWYLDIPDGYYIFDVQKFEYTAQKGDKFHQHQCRHEFSFLPGEVFWETEAIAFNDGPVIPIHRRGSFLFDIGPDIHDEDDGKRADIQTLFG